MNPRNQTEKEINDSNDSFMYVNEGDATLDLDDDGAHTNLDDVAPIDYDDEPKSNKKVQPKQEKIDDMLNQDSEDNNDATDDDDEDEVVEKPKKEAKKEDKKESKKEDKPKKSKGKEATVDYNSVANNLKEKGVFTVDLPESIDNDEDMIGLFQKEQEAYKLDVDEYYNKKHGQIIDYLESGGDIKKFVEVQKEFPYDTMKEEEILSDDKAKEQMYYDYHTEKGMEDKEIKRNMKRAKDLEEFDEDVKDIFPKMQNLSKKKKDAVINAQIQEKKKQEQYQKDLNSNTISIIDKMEEFMPGQKMTKKMKDDMVKYATGDEVWAELSKDPAKTRVLMAQLKVLGLLDGKWDKVLNSATTQATKAIKSQIISYKGNGSDSDGDRESKTNTDAILSAFGKKYARK